MAKRLTDGELSELESRVMRLECSMGYIEKKERCISYKGRDDQELVDKLEKETPSLKTAIHVSRKPLLFLTVQMQNLG